MILKDEDYELVIDSVELIEKLANERLTDLIEREAITYNQVFKYSEAEIKYTEVGKILFCYWYDFYADKIEESKKIDNKL